VFFSLKWKEPKKDALADDARTAGYIALMKECNEERYKCPRTTGQEKGEFCDGKNVDSISQLGLRELPSKTPIA